MPLCTPSCNKQFRPGISITSTQELQQAHENRQMQNPSKMPFWHVTTERFNLNPHLSHRKSTPNHRRHVRMPSEALEIHLPIQPTAMATAETAKIEGLCHWPTLDHMQNFHEAPPRHQSTFHLQLLVVQRAEEASHPLETRALGVC